MQQHSGGVLSSLCCAPVLLSQGFAVCIAPNSEKSTKVIAENMNLALTDLMEMTSKKYIIPHYADDSCRTNTLLKTPCQSPCQLKFNEYLYKENMKGLKLFGCNNQSDLRKSEEQNKLALQLMAKIELMEKDSVDGGRLLTKSELMNGSVDGDRLKTKIELQEKDFVDDEGLLVPSDPHWSICSECHKKWPRHSRYSCPWCDRARYLCWDCCYAHVTNCSRKPQVVVKGSIKDAAGLPNNASELINKVLMADELLQKLMRIGHFGPQEFEYQYKEDMQWMKEEVLGWNNQNLFMPGVIGSEKLLSQLMTKMEPKEKDFGQLNEAGSRWDFLQSSASELTNKTHEVSVSDEFVQELQNIGYFGQQGSRGVFTSRIRKSAGKDKLADAAKIQKVFSPFEQEEAILAKSCEEGSVQDRTDQHGGCGYCGEVAGSHSNSGRRSRFCNCLSADVEAQNASVNSNANVCCTCRRTHDGLAHSCKRMCMVTSGNMQISKN